MRKITYPFLSLFLFFSFCVILADSTPSPGSCMHFGVSDWRLSSSPCVEKILGAEHAGESPAENTASDSSSTELYLREDDVLSEDAPTFDGYYSENLRYGASAEWFYNLDGDVDGNYYKVYALLYAYQTSCELKIIHKKQSGGETVLAGWTGVSTSSPDYYQWKSLHTYSGVNPVASSGDKIIFRVTSANSDKWVSVRFGGVNVKSYIKIPPPAPPPVAPIINTINDENVCEGASYTGPTPSLSQGTPPITWSLMKGPAGITIDDYTGIVNWQDPVAAGSPHTITIRATNSQGSDEESWSVMVYTKPSIKMQPMSQVMTAGDNASFSVSASGSEPLLYQWYKGGLQLSDSGNIWGAQTATLTIDPVGMSDTGNYTCNVSNTCGSETSEEATLTVNRPILNGDVNKDCIVNIFDLAAVGLAFGSKLGDINWNPNADLTGDGKINIFDLATVGLNYGKVC